MVLHSERWTLTDDFHQPQHSDPPPRLVCLGTPLATCALPTGVFYLLTYLLDDRDFDRRRFVWRSPSVVRRRRFVQSHGRRAERCTRYR